jgi:hypothetical protein
MGHRVRDTVRSVHVSRTRQSVIPCPSVDAWKRGPGQSSERTISFDMQFETRAIFTTCCQRTTSKAWDGVSSTLASV